MEKKTWRWDSDHRCHDDCAPDSSLDFEGDQVRYVGWCSDVAFGGGYTIGCQTVEEFLTQDPLDEKMPAALVAEIRAYLLSRSMR
ncbi:hypothetical protein GCM10022225_39230 [Plantactinospora mayteni]|uniref:Uncharacterized protein n=1 Tax=Plantactinospora mayteni TaxID=566021 RepID=A0ABQ4EWK6_9ACTN|nr:hypothetical protein [Plantactinospora mayteni]GIG99058.1 hypothetical protein Pma05_56310 [Plantactinospora mayteni]